jgi:hypothetical protein
MNYRKFNYLAIAKIPNIKFDIDKLKEEVARLNDKWVNVFQANQRIVCYT